MVHLFSEMFVLQFSKVEKASTEQVDAAHKQFMAALASLYLKHNTVLTPLISTSLPNS